MELFIVSALYVKSGMDVQWKGRAFYYYELP